MLVAFLDVGNRRASDGRNEQNTIHLRKDRQHIITGEHRRQVENDDFEPGRFASIRAARHSPRLMPSTPTTAGSISHKEAP